MEEGGGGSGRNRLFPLLLRKRMDLDGRKNEVLAFVTVVTKKAPVHVVVTDGVDGSGVLGAMEFFAAVPYPRPSSVARGVKLSPPAL